MQRAYTWHITSKIPPNFYELKVRKLKNNLRYDDCAVMATIKKLPAIAVSVLDVLSKTSMCTDSVAFN